MMGYYMYNNINFSILYIIICIIIMKVLMQMYSKIIKDSLIELKNKNDLIQIQMKPLITTGKKELFILQRKLYKNLMIMLFIVALKYSIVIIMFGLLSIIRFDIHTPYELPLLFDITNLSLTNVLSPQLAFISFIFYYLIYQLSLYCLKTIIYYINNNKIDNLKYNEGDG
jgi:hypothetical protein